MKSGKRSGSKQTNRQSRITLLILIVLLAGGGITGYIFLKPAFFMAQSGVADDSQQTYTTTVQRGDLRIAAAGSGKLVAYRSIDLSFSSSGVVTTLNVKLGDMVKVGQTLASLGNAQTLEANRAAAQLQVLKAQQTLNNLQQNGDLALAQSYSDLVAAQETYNAALKRSQRLAYARCSQDVATRLTVSLEKTTQALANIHAETEGSDAYLAAKKAYDTALANYNQCAAYTNNEKDSVQSALDIAASALWEVQDHYDTLKAASGIDPDELAMAEAQLKAAQTQLAKAEEELAGITLTAPIDGKITYLADSVGALMGVVKFITIADVSRATLEISVDESDLDKLLLGAPVTVTFDALPDQSFTGKVIQVNPQVTTSGQYRIVKGIAELDAESVKTIATLPTGLTASVTVKNQEVTNALLIPTIALQRLEDSAYGVMVKDSNGQLKLKTVTIGIQNSDYVEITSGLQEGDLVSTGSVNFIAAGSSTSSTSLKNAQNSGGFPEGPVGVPAP